MWLLLEGGSAHVGVGWEGLSPSLSVRGMGRAHLAFKVFVGLRGKEEFHDGGVTANRDLHERRHPILKERTEREGGTKRRGGEPNKNTHPRRG